MFNSPVKFFSKTRVQGVLEPGLIKEKILEKINQTFCHPRADGDSYLLFLKNRSNVLLVQIS